MLRNLMSLLLSLFYSKKESGAVAHQALPDFSNPVLVTIPEPVNSYVSGTYTAPEDGYFEIGASSAGDSQVNIWGAVNSSCISTLNGPQAKVFTPVTKGTTIWYELKPSTFHARFLPLIGGVLSYLQGGAICLNNLLHFLQKLSLEIKNRGFRQLIRRIGMETSRLIFNHCRITNLTITSKDTFRLRMALLSTQVPESLSSFVYKPKDFSLCMLADTTLWLFESIKEKQYFYKRKILKNFVDSYRLENPNNFRFGGALC